MLIFPGGKENIFTFVHVEGGIVWYMVQYGYDV
jgi:hypothetical protein